LEDKSRVGIEYDSKDGSSYSKKIRKRKQMGKLVLPKYTS